MIEIGNVWCCGECDRQHATKQDADKCCEPVISIVEYEKKKALYWDMVNLPEKYEKEVRLFIEQGFPLVDEDISFESLINICIGNSSSWRDFCFKKIFGEVKQ